eukprot:gene18295-18556_t
MKGDDLKGKGHKDLITVIGHISTLSTGEFVQASGQWIHDRQHGLQFKAQFLTATAPTTLEGIEKYLGSGMIKGIGPAYAKKLITAFKEEVFQIIEEEPSRLRQVPGIGPFRAERIIKGWADQKIIRDIMLFLHSHDISTARAVRIYKTYGVEAIQIISENPYRLARDIRGIGFISADKIAEKVGIEKTSLIRAQAGISYALTTAMDDGHCGLPKNQLLVLFVDEVSMVDVPLMNALLKAIPPKTALFLVGDIDQLPSKFFVKPQQAKLLQQPIDSKDSDFYFVEANDPESVLVKIIKMIKDRIPQKFGFSPIHDIQLLCPMTRGLVGTRNLNIELQKALNPPSEHSIQRFGYHFSVGDKVMQIENNYNKEVYNGDIGFIHSINLEESEVNITFDAKNIVYDFGELDEIVLAYATTIHKSQGSEYPAVIIPLLRNNCTRQLFFRFLDQVITK